MNSSQFIQKSIKTTEKLIKKLDDSEIPKTGTLILYIDIDNETSELRLKTDDDIQTKGGDDNGGHSGNPFP